MMNNTESNPLQDLIVHTAVLDSKMQTIQTQIACTKNEITNYERSIKEEEGRIDVLVKKINDFTNREQKIIANIDSLRETKKILQDMETNLKHQIQMHQERSEANKVAQQNLVAHYSKIAEEHSGIYNALPMAKERNQLRVEKLKKSIEVERLKTEHNVYKAKIKLFNSISEKRLQTTILTFVQHLVEREKEKQIAKDNIEYEKKIVKEIEELEERKKLLKEKVAMKAKDAVAKIIERNVNKPVRFPSYMVTSNIKPSSFSISIRERLGLKSGITFRKPQTPAIRPVTGFLSQALNSINAKRYTLLDTIDSTTANAEETSLSSSGTVDNNNQQQLSQPDVGIENSVQNLTVTTVEPEPLLSESEGVRQEEPELQSELHQNKELQEQSQTEDINKQPALVNPNQSAGDQIHELPLTTGAAVMCNKPPTNDELNAKNLLVSNEAATQQRSIIKKQALKRLSSNLQSEDARDDRKTRRVSFQSMPSGDGVAEKGRTADKLPPPVLLSDEIPAEKSVPEVELIQPVATSEEQPQELERSSSQETLASSAADSIAYDRGGYVSPTYAENEHDNQNLREVLGTPRIDSYFSSPAYSTKQDRPSRTLSSFKADTPVHSRNEENGTTSQAYSFPLATTSNTQITLSPPFAQKTPESTNAGNRGFESFFGGPASDTKKTKNFFDLF